MGIDHLVAIKAYFLRRGVISKHPESFTPIISTSELSEMYGSCKGDYYEAN